MAKLAQHILHKLTRRTHGSDLAACRSDPSNATAAIASLLFGSVLALALQPSTAHAEGRKNDLPPRQQWEANYGYCGEVSLISAGLYYGQYVSQHDARAIASKNANQAERDSQLLLGVNDAYAAAQMHLTAVAWKNTTSSDTEDFLAWVKGNVAAGYPVAIAVYENRSTFEESDDPEAGDDEYDHIVPVTGISSKHPLTKPAQYNADDKITFNDNAHYTPNDEPLYVYSYTFASFQATRREANSKAHPVYSLARGGNNYGLAITGIIDKDGQALPVRLSTNVNYEKPEMKDGSNARPAARDLTLTVAVSGLKPGLSYNLYRYDSFESVPNSGFNAAAKQADKKWKIKINSGSTFSLKEKIKSDQIAVYRAVPETAP